MINIAIVDDKIVNRKTVQRNISSSADIRIVLEAGNGSEFLEKMEAIPEPERPRVVLMDIDMPVMNGWDATIEIRKRDPNIPIIALTAYSEESFRKKSFEAGMNMFLSKPYNKEEIYEAILNSIN